jgi:hypothetical protein
VALTLAQKSNCRRHLGYPVTGLTRLGAAGGTLFSGAAGYRFTQAYGFLEYRLNNLNPDEEARLLGTTFGSVLLNGPSPNSGDSVSVTLSGGTIPSPQTLTATIPGPSINIGDGRLWYANKLAALCSLNTVLQAAGIISVAPYGTGPFSGNAVPLPEVSFTCATPFTITASGTGVLAPQITSNPALLSPSASLDGVTTTWGYLPILDGLEAALTATTQNQDTREAGPWKSRSNEAGMRLSLYRWHQMAMSDYLGSPMNPQRFNHARNSGAMRYA